MSYSTRRDDLFIQSGFSLTNIHDSQDNKGKGRLSLAPFYHFLPLHRHLDISRVITAESYHLYT